MSVGFVHHHVHSEYSLLDAPISVKALVQQTKKLGYKAISLTDHGTISGWVKFSGYCKDNGIKPIFGVEAYFTPNCQDRSTRNDSHLILLAKNNVGIKNIFYLMDSAAKQGFHYVPRIDWPLLEKYGEGLIISTACVGGYVPELYYDFEKKGPRPDGYENAKAAVLRFKELLGPDFYIELQYHGLDVEDAIYPVMAKIASETGVKTLATNDVHFLLKKDANMQEVMMAASMKKCLKDPNRLKHDTNQFYLKSQEEMFEIFGGADKMSITSSLEIADKCTAELKAGKTQLPSLEIPKGYASELEYLEKTAYEGLKRLGKAGVPEYEARFKEEMDVVKRLREKGRQFDRYFLVVADYVRWAWDHGIRVGAGRGSGAGSLLLYCLRVTGIDPLPLDLLFERFLDDERNEMPDIDIDFDSERGDEVYAYVCEKYGHDRCSRIGTFGTFQAAGSIKAAFRVFDPGGEWEKEQRRSAKAKNRQSRDKAKGSRRQEKKENDHDENKILADEITKQLREDDDAGGEKWTFNKEKYEADPAAIAYIYEDLPEFKNYKRQYPEIFEFCEFVEGIVCGKSKHAAGVLITQDPMVELCPQQYVKAGTLTTAFDMNDVEKLGGTKFDFLQTKALAVITRTLATIKKIHGIDVDIDNIKTNDPKALEIFTKAKTLAIFQFESDGMRKCLSKMKPDTFEDVIAANALFRPGPMRYIDMFCNRKHGLEKIAYTTPLLEKILKPTYGVMVYQEQVMKAVRVLAGFSGSEADKVRKAMGKKKKDVLEQMKDKFLKGCKRLNTCSEEVAKKIWADMESFSMYGFNKSHSAAYSYTAYQCAYLKAYYPAEYMAAQLTVEGGDAKFKVILNYENGAQNMGIKLLPLDVNTSKAEYTVEGKTGHLSIRRGFRGVKGVGSAGDDIAAQQPYKNMYDFCLRAGAGSGSGVVTALIDNKAFDWLLPSLSTTLGRPATRKDIEAEYADKSQKAAKEKNMSEAQKAERRGIGNVFSSEEDSSDVSDAAKKAEGFSL